MADSYTVSTLTPLRKIIAARMTQAKRDIPHFRLVVDFEMDALLELRKRLAEGAPQAQASLTDLLIKACALALLDTPAINIQWIDAEIHQYHSADISIVIAVEGGLSTPIIRRAEGKTVLQIATEMRDLRARASRNALKMHEISGGTFSISNLGMHAVDQFDAIINPPQCAILAVGRTRPCWRVGSQGEPRVASVATMTLSVDHRAIDGVIAAQFLSVLRRHVEQPQWLRAEE